MREGRFGCNTELSLPELARASDVHTANVRRYFGTGEARGRLLELDFTAPDAGRVLCTFVLANHSACGHYTALPNVAPEELDSEWAERFGGERVSSAIRARLGAAPARGGFTCSMRHACHPRP